MTHAPRRMRPGLRLVVLATMLAGPAPAATAQRPTARPITWCEHPVARTRWATHDVLVAIRERDAVRTGTSAAEDTSARLSRPVLALILESIAPRVLAISGLGTGSGGRLPAGDTRYTPAVLRTEVAFTLGGDGALVDATVGPHSDTTFANDLLAALRASSEAHELVLNGNSASRFALELFVTDPGRSSAVWRAFTIYAPGWYPAKARRMRPAIRYPDAATRWEATFVLQFVVGWNGKVRRETMRTVPAIDAYRWPSPEERWIFEEFIDHVKYAVAQWEFLPAEIAGCRVDQLAQQEYTFRR